MNVYRDGRHSVIREVAGVDHASIARTVEPNVTAIAGNTAKIVAHRIAVLPSVRAGTAGIMACAAFERIAATLGSPMVIVTTRADDKMDGCLVGFSTQCSIDPPRYLVCLSVNNRTYELAQRASTLAVHTLHDDQHDRGLARVFGEHTARDVDKLADIEWEPGPDGVPVLGSCDWFAGPILGRINLGDHVGFTIDARYGRAVRTGEPYLKFSDVSDLTAGNPA